MAEAKEAPEQSLEELNTTFDFQLVLVKAQLDQAFENLGITLEANVQKEMERRLSQDAKIEAHAQYRRLNEGQSTTHDYRKKADESGLPVEQVISEWLLGERALKWLEYAVAQNETANQQCESYIDDVLSQLTTPIQTQYVESFKRKLREVWLNLHFEGGNTDEDKISSDLRRVTDEIISQYPHILVSSGNKGPLYAGAAADDADDADDDDDDVDSAISSDSGMGKRPITMVVDDSDSPTSSLQNQPDVETFQVGDGVAVSLPAQHPPGGNISSSRRNRTAGEWTHEKIYRPLKRAIIKRPRATPQRVVPAVVAAVVASIATVYAIYTESPNPESPNGTASGMVTAEAPAAKATVDQAKTAVPKSKQSAPSKPKKRKK